MDKPQLEGLRPGSRGFLFCAESAALQSRWQVYLPVCLLACLPAYLLTCLPTGRLADLPSG